MIPQRICVTVETSTKVRFITSIVNTNTIKDTLPLLLNRYREVVSENIKPDQYNIEQFTANSIKQITKNGYLIPLKEYVSDVIVNGDQLFINLQNIREAQSAINHQQTQKAQSKKQKLEKKKEQKKSVEHKKENSQIKQQPKKEQKRQNLQKQQSNLQKTSDNNISNIKEPKKSDKNKDIDHKDKQQKSTIQRVKISGEQLIDIAKKLHHKMQLGYSPLAKGIQKKKVIVVQQQSSSD